VDEGRNHDGRHTPAPVSRLRTIAVNEALTMLLTVVRLASAAGLCQGPAMTTRNTRAGGCFLTVCILAGFPLGLAIKNPMKGILIGTGVGAALAVLLWLIDRRKGA
jgi:cyanate permease